MAPAHFLFISPRAYWLAVRKSPTIELRLRSFDQENFDVHIFVLPTRQGITALSQ
jgi:hypothetical protein